MWYATIVGFDPVSYLEQIGGKSYEIMQFEGEGHNLKESKYELPLYNWLKGINNYSTFKFKKH